MTRVFLDTETTGLDYSRHTVIELAWAVEDGPITTLVLPHNVEDAEPVALKVNRYYERGLDKAETASQEDVEGFLSDVEGATLVGANPRFDATMLVNTLELTSEPWHYRLLDLSAFAAGKLDAPLPLGMRELYKRMTQLGFSVPLPDHSAAGDVEATRAIYRMLTAFQTRAVSEEG